MKKAILVFLVGLILIHGIPAENFKETNQNSNKPMPPNILGDLGTKEMLMMQNKLRGIVFPTLGLYNVTLREAVDDLNKLSIQFDYKEPDIEKKGVGIVIKKDAEEPIETEANVPSNGKLAASRFSLNRQNISLLEAIHQVATLAGKKVRIEPYAVIIVPVSVPEPLITKEYIVSPDFLE